MNIGIGIGFVSPNESFLNNETSQNAIFLYLLLKKIKHINVYLINFGLNIDELSKETKYFLTPFKTKEWKEVINDIKLDIFINPNLFINDKIIEVFKNKNIKLVRIDTTNSYVTDINDIFLNTKSGIYKDIYDEIWIYQNNTKINKTYLETIYNSKIEIMPLIWNNYFIEKMKKINPKYVFKYVEHEKKDITIFDSNNNLHDMSIYSLLLLEKIYNSNSELFKNKINKIRLINSLKLKENLKYISIVNRLNIMKNGFCSFENNYDSFSILSKHTDIVVSNQLDNQLKHFYFESLYGGYLLIHNSENLKSVGYYYNDDRINYIKDNFFGFLDNHNNTLEKYNLKVDKILNRYSIENIEIINKYNNKLSLL